MDAAYGQDVTRERSRGVRRVKLDVPRVRHHRQRLGRIACGEEAAERQASAVDEDADGREVPTFVAEDQAVQAAHEGVWN